MPRLIGPLPTVTHQRSEISIDTARSYVAAYLFHSESKPYLHPDSFLGPNGVEFSTNGSGGGSILHLLRRIERGLAGKILDPEPELQEGDDTVPNSQTDNTPASKKRKHTGEEEAAWEDPDQYALEQEGDGVESNYAESNYAATPVHVPDVLIEDEETEPTAGVRLDEKKKDKSKTKKEAKKARRKEAKKAKLGKGKAGSDDEDTD
jgi:hypothetical protein